jgi:hypothetical protein
VGPGDSGVGLLDARLLELRDRLLGRRVEDRDRHDADSNTDRAAVDTRTFPLAICSVFPMAERPHG